MIVLRQHLSLVQVDVERRLLRYQFLDEPTVPTVEHANYVAVDREAAAVVRDEGITLSVQRASTTGPREQRYGITPLQRFD